MRPLGVGNSSSQSRPFRLDLGFEHPGEGRRNGNDPAGALDRKVDAQRAIGAGTASTQTT
jgi:hypothetical protein